ncbi:PucR family transcriptional regulator [Pseudonocardia broussonetiae]|uniref:Helix-turn-helix domain-containing protein n=1 Tax=Pseudonocardia broussonetiae TaxID=2736640 RepID=A0A6M6JJ47_9PSEU|nr:helix-turn-helix domain-containing protein [Pseudonocardia broussonetiae]QJY47173.1 helix-turn-helix domain-containing protein [Pseudonocardia broussonetiae]
MPSPTAVDPVAPAAPTPGADPVLSFLVGAVRDRLRLARCAVLLGEDGGASAGDGDVSPAARAALRDRVTVRDAGALAVALRVGGEVRGVLELVPGPVDGPDLAGAVALAEAALGRCARPSLPDPLRSLPARLSRAVLGGAEPDDVVALLAELLGRPVALLGPDLRVRTWAAPPVLHLVEPPALPAALPAAAAGELDALGPDRPSTVLLPRPLSGLTRRHLVAVLVAEGATAGYLDLIEMGRPLAPAETPLAEHAATLLSLQVLGETRRLRAAALARDDVLADLLLGSRGGSPRSLDDLRRLAAHVGLDLTRPQLVVRLPVAPHRSPAACRDAVADALAPVLDGPPPAHAGPDDVVLLVALPADADPSALRRVHAALRTGLDAVARHTGVRRAVVSGVCHDLPDLPPALAETREVDRIVDALGGRADVVAVTELSTLRLVVNGDRADVALRFAEQCLGPLRRSDETGGGDLVETLRRYLDCGAQVRATAKALGVHENTVRYRLGRIEHVTGMDVRRFDTLLAAQLAFQVEGLGAGLETSTTAAADAVAARGARS